MRFVGNDLDCSHLMKIYDFGHEPFKYCFPNRCSADSMETNCHYASPLIRLLILLLREIDFLRIFSTIITYGAKQINNG